MPKKLDLSDRYARGQRRNRRRTVSRPLEDIAPLPDTGTVTVAEPTADPPAATPRTPSRARAVTLQNYHYIRSDLIKIAIVTGIVLVVMFGLFLVIR